MKNLVLKSITAVAAVTCIGSAWSWSFGSETPVKVILCFASMIWLLLFVIANEKRREHG